jgi:hypothetical protein
VYLSGRVLRPFLFALGDLRQVPISPCLGTEIDQVISNLREVVGATDFVREMVGAIEFEF